jgi:hypothetical protein
MAAKTIIKCNFEIPKVVKPATYHADGTDKTDADIISVPCPKPARHSSRDEEGNVNFACDDHKQCLETAKERIDGSTPSRRVRRR